MATKNNPYSLSFSIIFLLFAVLPLSSNSDTTGSNGGSRSDAPFVGVCISTELSNPLEPEDLASFLLSQKISHVRLYNPDAALLSALGNTGIDIVVGIPNDEILALGSSPNTASTWVATRILPFLPNTSISAIAVGDETPTAVPSSLPHLLPALQYLADALSSSNASKVVQVSTPLPFSIVLDPFPPSQAFFNHTLVRSFMLPLLTFLSNNSSPLMINLYPYYEFMHGRGIIPLDTSLFKQLPASLEMVDPNTLLHYTNVYDAMLDAVHFAMRSLNFTNITVLVTESGWPSLGAPKEEPFATKDNADTHNSNLIKHVLDNTGTPLLPEVTSSVYIYELFNEDRRPGPVSEANWGLFYGNGTPVYLLHMAGTGDFLASDTTNRTFCVAADGADVKALQAALDWACGPGRADCQAIQPGESCYSPNDLKTHSSFAFDSYYQRQGRSAGSCYFQGAAIITTTDPSHGGCIFPGSKLANSSIIEPIRNNTQSSNARPGKDTGVILPGIITVLVAVMTSL